MDHKAVNGILTQIRLDNDIAATKDTAPPAPVRLSDADLHFINTALLHRQIHFAAKLEVLDFACHQHRQHIAYLKQQFTIADDLAQRIKRATGANNNH